MTCLGSLIFLNFPAWVMLSQLSQLFQLMGVTHSYMYNCIFYTKVWTTCILLRSALGNMTSKSVLGKSGCDLWPAKPSEPPCTQLVVAFLCSTCCTCHSCLATSVLCLFSYVCECREMCSQIEEKADHFLGKCQNQVRKASDDASVVFRSETPFLLLLNWCCKLSHFGGVRFAEWRETFEKSCFCDTL